MHEGLKIKRVEIWDRDSRDCARKRRVLMPDWIGLYLSPVSGERNRVELIGGCPNLHSMQLLKRILHFILF